MLFVCYLCEFDGHIDFSPALTADNGKAAKGMVRGNDDLIQLGGRVVRSWCVGLFGKNGQRRETTHYLSTLASYE